MQFTNMFECLTKEKKQRCTREYQTPDRRSKSAPPLRVPLTNPSYRRIPKPDATPCQSRPESVETESFGGNPGELDKPIHDTVLPFSKTILRGSELTVRGHGSLVTRNNGTLLGIERGEHTRRVPGVAGLK